MAKMTLDELVAQLRAVHGDGLVTVVLYGSAAAGGQIPKRSDQNVLVIVDRLDVPRLQAAAAVARAWREGGNPPPLTLTLDEWRGSGDVFPMEYADILERHRVLHGRAPFEGIRVDPADLRLQLERESLGKLLQFRQGILASGNDRRELMELLEASLSTFMVIFRSLLRLMGETPSADYEALSRAVAERVGFDPEPFVQVVRHVRREAQLASAAVDGVLAGYLAGLERLVAFIDRYVPAR